MKDIRQISLNSIVFYVEENGYVALKKYIDNLERYYATKEGGKEIVEDIQIRFAELLSEKRTFTEQAITLSDIENVISVLGYPDSFEPESSKESQQEEAPPNKKRKQLYRDAENAKIAGVCSGLSYYLGIDMWIIRLIYIGLVIFWGFGILLYFILWFIIPQARSTQQKYEMKGEALNIEDIEQRVKSGIHEAETKVRNFASKNADTIRDTANEISSSAKNIFKIIGKILGFCFIFASVCAIVTILVVWFVPIPSIFKAEPEYSIFCMREIFTFFGLNNTALFLCLMCILLPLVLLLLLGITCLTSKLKKTMGIVILCIFIVWIAISTFFAIGMATFVGDRLTSKNETFIEEEIKLPSVSQTIVIKSYPDKASSFTQIHFFGRRLYIESETGQNQLYGITRLDEDIVYTNDSVITVRIFKNNCKEKIIHEFQNNIKMEDSILYIPYLFPLQKDYWSGEKIKVQLFVPKGKQLIIEEPFVWRKM